MAALGLLLVVAVVVVGLASGRSGTRRADDGRLRAAVQAGIISQDQADRIVAITPAASASAPAAASAGGARRAAASVSPATEALGYLGALLAMAGVTTLVTDVWDDLSPWARVSLLGAVAAGFLVAGLFVRDDGNAAEVDDAAVRLRSFLLLLSTAAAAGSVGLLAAEVLDWSAAATTRLVGGTVAVESSLLWARRPTRPAQHLTAFGGLVTLVAATVAELESPGVAGVVLWLVAGAWLVAGWRGFLPPAELAYTLGGFTMLVSCLVVAGSWEAVAPLTGLATAAGLLAVGTQSRRPALTGAGVVGVLGYAPYAIVYFFGDTVGVPVALLVAGGLLLVLALRHLRPRGTLGPDPMVPA
jgi:hypothetical protein